MQDEIFSRERRRLNRTRALRSDPDSRWLAARSVEELIERLRFMTIEVKRALIFGDGRGELTAALPADCDVVHADLVDESAPHLVCDEDRLPISDGTFDLVFASGTLDTVHDLPGALLLFRKALRPGGLFLGSFVGGGSLTALRSTLQALEEDAGSSGAARFHPQVDVRSAGDLLFRAGFSTPVADIDEIDVRYGSAARLVSDIRANGLGNAMPLSHPLRRIVADKLLQQPDLIERFAMIFLTGWAPSANEVRPSGPVKGF